jgi:V/A-type H+/Na+-transporting ATPase subunit I
MLVPMTRVRILGRREDTGRVLGELHRLGVIEIADARADTTLGCADNDAVRSVRAEELLRMRGKIEQRIATLPAQYGAPATARPPEPAAQDLGDLRAEVDHLTGNLDELDQRLHELRDERLVLSGYLGSLQQLLPLVPVLARLDDEGLGQLGLATVALILNTDQEDLVDTLRAELAAVLGSRYELVPTPAQQGSRGCLVVLPSDRRDTVQAILGRAAVRRVALPGRFVGLSLHATVDAMAGRLEEISGEIDVTAEERSRSLLQSADRLMFIRSALADQIELWQATESVGVTERAFLLECWVPRPRLRYLRRELVARLGSSIVVEERVSSPYDPESPVLLRNARLPRPFEALVGFLGLPRPGSVDPTFLMGVFLPLMFGAMVGDVGYGAVLLALAIIARTRLARRTARQPEIRGLLEVLLWGSGWSMIFGVLYGEVFGDLGRRMFGDWAVWQYRASAGALEPLLVLAVAVGAAHVGLGLVLGAWQAIRLREPRVLLDKLGTILALTGLFGLAAGAAHQFQAGALTVSVGAVVVGLVLVLSLHGSLGLITGALDLVGRIGNILSYLRLAAVGLASAHLAGVANELGSMGPIWIGVLVATFLHALNLALAAFSPMIQSLRLNYVEFFGTFFVSGGHAFTPFGHEQRTEIPSTT